MRLHWREGKPVTKKGKKSRDASSTSGDARAKDRLTAFGTVHRSIGQIRDDVILDKRRRIAHLVDTPDVPLNCGVAIFINEQSTTKG